MTIGSRTHKAQSSEMPLGNRTCIYEYLMAANSHGLPLTGEQLTSLGPELAYGSYLGPPHHTYMPVTALLLEIRLATWQSNAHVWVVIEYLLTWPAFDWRAVDRVGRSYRGGRPSRGNCYRVGLRAVRRGLA